MSNRGGAARAQVRTAVVSCAIVMAGMALLPSAPAKGDTAVIPPGREELLADMLGRGATLPGGCRFASGDVDGPVARGKYACPGGEAAIELRHPSGASSGAIRTERFAVVAAGGTVPAGLLDAVAGLVRAREAQFEWKMVRPNVPNSSPAGAPPRSIAPLVVPIAILVFALVIALRRRRAKRASG